MPRGSRRQIVANSLLAGGTVTFLLIGVFSVGADDSATEPVTRNVSVTRGVIQSSVSASGNIKAADDLSLSFQGNGQVTAIYVSVGDRVAAGKVLAQLDDRTQRASLSSAQASLTSANEKLAQSDRVLTDQEVAQNDAGAAAAQVQVDSAQTALTNAQNVATVNAVSLQTAVNQAQVNYDTCIADPPAAGCVTQENALQNAQNSQTSGLARDQQTLDQSQNSLNQALASQQTTLINNAAKAQPPKPGDRAAAVASIASAQSSVVSATKALEDTKLVAPSAGTVSAINGEVGTSSSGSGGSSGTSTGSTGGTTGGGTSGSTSSSSSTTSSGFITLTNLDSLQLVAGFSESDVAKVKVGQPAVVTFDALGGAKVSGSVQAIATTSTVVSNVVTYDVKVLLTQRNAEVKVGMTASVEVIIEQRDNVLRVPTAAVTGRGSTGTVTVAGKDGKKDRQVQVTVGLRGDDAVEITSGLEADEQVVITSTTGAAGGAGGFTFPGGGGGGLGGGGGIIPGGGGGIIPGGGGGR